MKKLKHSKSKKEIKVGRLTVELPYKDGTMVKRYTFKGGFKLNEGALYAEDYAKPVKQFNTNAPLRIFKDEIKLEITVAEALVEFVQIEESSPMKKNWFFEFLKNKRRLKFQKKR